MRTSRSELSSRAARDARARQRWGKRLAHAVAIESVHRATAGPRERVVSLVALEAVVGQCCFLALVMAEPWRMLATGAAPILRNAVGAQTSPPRLDFLSAGHVNSAQTRVQLIPRTVGNEAFDLNASGVGASVNPAFITAHAVGVAAKRNVSQMSA